MKIRGGFVSNSSSSSFVISKAHVTPAQLKLIRSHSIKAPKLVPEEVRYSRQDHTLGGDAWTITENDRCIGGFTWMDNFDFFHYLVHIGVDLEKVQRDLEHGEWREIVA